ncbi:hypothetical protein J23TS9_12980 [Paenibacillus sp. J23TS9]|nr:hypothetical protein J23TS9_12980 [Paenibacillus sp. J23TS9]
MSLDNLQIRYSKLQINQSPGFSDSRSTVYYHSRETIIPLFYNSKGKGYINGIMPHSQDESMFFTEKEHPLQPI